MSHYNHQYRRARAIVLAGQPPCFNCDAAATTADHVLPVSRGGTHALANLRPACARCNASRGNRMVTRFHATW